MNHVRLYTYGSPRVGDQNFVDHMNEKIGQARIYNVQWDGDYVPTVPPFSWGYVHVGTIWVCDKFENCTRLKEDHKKSASMLNLVGGLYNVLVRGTHSSDGKYANIKKPPQKS